MIPEPCTVSKPLTAKRKEIRRQIRVFAMLWPTIDMSRTFLNTAKHNYAQIIRRGHIFRMDGLPKVFPDGSMLPTASQGHRLPEKKTETKGKTRRPI